jgi:hypothetical protein
MDLINAKFDMGQQFDQRTAGSIFGSLDDARKYFGANEIHLFAANMEPRLTRMWKDQSGTRASATCRRAMSGRSKKAWKQFPQPAAAGRLRSVRGNAGGIAGRDQHHHGQHPHPPLAVGCAAKHRV